MLPGTYLSNLLIDVGKDQIRSRRQRDGWVFKILLVHWVFCIKLQR